MQRRVVVTGMGVINSIGNNIKEFELSLKEGRSGIKVMERASDPELSIRIGAEINNFSFEAILEKNSLFSRDAMQKAKQCAERSPFGIQASVVSTLEAWNMANCSEKYILSDRIGIIVTGSNLTNNYQYNAYPKFMRTPEYLSPRYALHFLDTDYIGTLSEIFNIQGEGFTIGGASASGNLGIIKGFQLIQFGILDACLVVGAMADLSPIDLQGFYNLGAMGGKLYQNDAKGACRPFDRDHEGFIYGQGSGCLILESSESAARRNVNVYAEILGGSQSLDGNRLSDPLLKGEIKAMKSALKNADVSADDIDYINTHGTSSPLGDEIEVKAIRNVFENNLHDVWINATKGLIGHCLYSAGVVEAIAVIIQLQKDFLHPNLNLDNPIDDECRFCGPKAEEAEIKTAVSNSFGFGGINTSIIIKKGEECNAGWN